MVAPRNDVPSLPTRFDPGAGPLPWGESDPREAGLDPDPLLRADEDIRNHYPKMFCFLVVKDARLVFERYYGGADAAAAMDLRSATKSVIAAAAACAGLFGEAAGEPPKDATEPAICTGGAAGAIRVASAGAKAASLTLGELFDGRLPKTASAELAATTTLQLLAMTSGLHWRTGPRLGEPFVLRMHRARDWVRFALRLPIRPELRGAFLYRSADSHLLSAAVTVRAGRTAADVAQEAFFGPLGTAAPRWEADPQGVSTGHIGLHLTGRDLAKLGWLHATGGVWEGKRLLPDRFADAAFTPQGDGMPAFGRYGGHWWIARTQCGEAVRIAMGHGGQAVFVSPERRLVAVFAANPKTSRWKHPIDLYERFVLAADGERAERVCNSPPFVL